MIRLVNDEKIHIALNFREFKEIYDWCAIPSRNKKVDEVKQMLFDHLKQYHEVAYPAFKQRL